MRHLSSTGRATFQAWDRRSTEAQDLTERALRAVLGGNATAFRESIEGLQPGAGARAKLVLAIYLSKSAYHVFVNKQATDFEPRWAADGEHSITINWGPQFADRFTASEAQQLWEKFSDLDRHLRSDEDQFVPGYQNRQSMPYYFEEMAPNFGVEEFIASWAA